MMLIPYKPPVYIAGLYEEPIKLFVPFLIFAVINFKKKKIRAVDAILWPIIFVLTFAVGENILYAYTDFIKNGLQSAQNTLIIRTFVSIPVHFIVLYMALALWFWRGLIVAIIIHGLFNYAVTEELFLAWMVILILGYISIWNVVWFLGNEETFKNPLV